MAAENDDWSLDEYNSDDDKQPACWSHATNDTFYKFRDTGDLSDFSEPATIESLAELRSIHDSESPTSADEADSAHIQAAPGDVNFRLEQSFASIDDFYEAVKTYGVQNMYNLTFLKKDKIKCRVKCVNDCPWLIYCSKVGCSETYKVKTFISSHTCQKEGVKANFADTKWLGNKLIEDFREHPNMTGPEVKDLIYKKCNVMASIAKAYRVKAYASQSLHGNVAQQYSKLPNYCAELLKTNPGSTVELICPKHGENGPSRFDRIYVCIDACKKGFINGCRPLIALDGCHLSGYYRGQLLAAVSLDGNNGLFIVAYAIVSSETRET
ncbi:unnamed protein product [Cuscuta epithymum]|uniref:Transposase MuDR plant domain-containing protein n=1 Tax=Cuscuta epithymum TaxID=186058 RepID=A0AAV0EHY5_9ASTE|nr:unnamed protein product [Cuscuta epithymum]